MRSWARGWKYTDALVLGNLGTAILGRNELFGRLLYLLTNMLFAKVCTGGPHWVLGHRSLTHTFCPWFRLVQHLGGHSGCTRSWHIFRLVLIFNNHKDNPDPVLLAGAVMSVFRVRWKCAPLGLQQTSTNTTGLLDPDNLKQSILIVSLSDTIGSAGGLGSCSVSGGYCILRF